MTLTIKLDGNWNIFQLANSAPPLSAIDSAIPLSARMRAKRQMSTYYYFVWSRAFFCSLLRWRKESTHRLARYIVTPKGVFRPALCHASATLRSLWASKKGHSPQQKWGERVVSSLSVALFKYLFFEYVWYICCMFQENFKNKKLYVNSIRRSMRIHQTAWRSA